MNSKKVEMKVGQIIEVSRIEGADKLYKLKVDIGEENFRQIVSGLVPYYTDEELTNKKIIVVTNLKQAKFRGEESNGMLLAAGNEEKDTCVLLTVEKDIEIGSVIT